MQDASGSISEAVNWSSSLAADRNSHFYKVHICTRYLTGLCALLWITSFISYISAEWLHTLRQPPYVKVYPRPRPQITDTLRAFGFIGIIIGVGGWWGALHGRHATVFMFSCLTFFSAIVEMGCGAVTLSYAGKTTLLMNKDVNRDLRRIKDPKANEKTNEFLALQENLECCGVHSYKDWIASPWWESQRALNSNVVVPESCCVGKNVSLECYTGKPPYKDVIAPNLIHEMGCMERISNHMDFLYCITGGFAFVCGMLKFAGFFLIHYYANVILAHKNQIANDASDRNA